MCPAKTPTGKKSEAARGINNYCARVIRATARHRQARRVANYIYIYWVGGSEYWLFTLYDKNGLSDLAKRERATRRSLEDRIEDEEASMKKKHN